jgi:RPA family protein
MPDVKRQTAYKCSIKMIIEGEYIQRPGWDPNFIKINNLQISRVNLLGVIVGKEGNNNTLDDGTGQISIMVFGDQTKVPDVSVGDVVQIIGRPREYDKRRFVVPEIIKKIEDSRWIDYRKLELAIQEKDNFVETNKSNSKFSEKNIVNDSKESKKESGKDLQDKEKVSDKQTEKSIEKHEPVFEENYASIILSTIKKLDKGDGANVNDIIKQSGLEKADKYIISLINEGEIFEIRTGRIKILE